MEQELTEVFGQDRERNQELLKIVEDHEVFHLTE